MAGFAALSSTLLAAASQLVSAYPNGLGAVSLEARDGALQARQIPDPSEFVWSTITPSRELEWHDCHDGLQCARLIVPLDYSDCRSNRTVTLAVAMLPATDRENYLGPLFMNPGGPGVSGVDYLLISGRETLQPYFGANHDIISWDTRGLGRSTPKQSCFANHQRRGFWTAPWDPVNDGYNSEDESLLAQDIQKYKYENAKCKNMLGHTGILEHTHAENHARDMDSILKATGHDKLRYFGFSYGTVLAVHYASLFPHKVGRILSEGNVDVAAFSRGETFMSLGDAQRNKNYLYERCAAEPSCPFHESTPEAVGQRIDALLEELRLRPRIKYSPTRTSLVNDGQARADIDLTFRELMTLGPWLLMDLAMLEGEDLMQAQEADYLELHDSFYWLDVADTTPSRPYDPDYWMTSYEKATFKGLAEEITMCADGLGGDVDVEELIAEYKRARELTPSAAWPMSWKLFCAGATETRKKFTGPFGGNTSFPLLFVNGWDIVTPLASAHRNAELFPGSPVVALDSYGHGITRYSRCVWEIVKAYFQDGTVPEDTTCKDIAPLKFGDDHEWPNPWPWENPEDWEEEEGAAVVKRELRREVFYEKLRHTLSTPRFL